MITLTGSWFYGAIGTNIAFRLLDKIAKQILVCENKTIRQWDGTISEYKNYLRKKMISEGAV
jgi:ATP-binding cassette subfamily F protein 2